MIEVRNGKIYIDGGELAPWCYPTDPRHPWYRMMKENKMSLHEDLGLDPNVNRNSFTKEDAVKVFEKAVEKLNSGEAAADLVDELLDIGFEVLKTIALFA